MNKAQVIIVLVYLLLAFGCSPRTGPPKVLDELRQTQQQSRIAIGWVYQEHELNVIVFNNSKAEIRKYSVPTEEVQNIAASRGQPIQIEKGTDAMRSPDGKAMVYRTRENRFVLADSNGNLVRTLFDGKRVLTPLYWSPDSRYLMYVEKGGTWDPAGLRCGDDTFYVMVYRVSDGTGGSVFQGCQGFPYTAFQWVRVPENLPL